MINANELRIGNLFWENYGGYKIVAGINHHKNDSPITISAHGIGFKAVGAFDLEHIYPIPLTPEILEKCGFVKEILDSGNEDEGYFYSLRLSDDKYVDLSLLSGDKNGICEVFLFPYEQLRYQYLHQVQNIVNALTGKELEISL